MFSVLAIVVGIAAGWAVGRTAGYLPVAPVLASVAAALVAHLLAAAVMTLIWVRVERKGYAGFGLEVPQVLGVITLGAAAAGLHVLLGLAGDAAPLSAFNRVVLIPTAAGVYGGLSVARARRILDRVDSSPVGVMLEDTGWEIVGRRVDASTFFRALGEWAPHGAILVLEGGDHPAPLRTYLETCAVEPRMTIARGTIWPKAGVVHVPSTPAVLARLADFAETCAGPEVCDHLHVYDEAGLVLEWYDAFWDPIRLSKRVMAEQIDTFSAALGATSRPARED